MHWSMVLQQCDLDGSLELNSAVIWTAGEKFTPVKDALKQCAFHDSKVWWAPVLTMGKLEVLVFDEDFPGETAEGAALLVDRIPGVLARRFPNADRCPVLPFNVYDISFRRRRRRRKAKGEGRREAAAARRAANEDAEEGKGKEGSERGVRQKERGEAERAQAKLLSLLPFLL